jgi:hypothetical protein
VKGIGITQNCVVLTCEQALGSELVRIERECVSAFVVFEHRKSWERCLVGPLPRTSPTHVLSPFKPIAPSKTI